MYRAEYLMSLESGILTLVVSALFQIAQVLASMTEIRDKKNCMEGYQVHCFLELLLDKVLDNCLWLVSLDYSYIFVAAAHSSQHEVPTEMQLSSLLAEAPAPGSHFSLTFLCLEVIYCS